MTEISIPWWVWLEESLCTSVTQVDAPSGEQGTLSDDTDVPSVKEFTRRRVEMGGKTHVVVVVRMEGGEMYRGCPAAPFVVCGTYTGMWSVCVVPCDSPDMGAEITYTDVCDVMAVTARGTGGWAAGVLHLPHEGNAMFAASEWVVPPCVEEVNKEEIRYDNIGVRGD